jgi:micrococcal nuclease
MRGILFGFVASILLASPALAGCRVEHVVDGDTLHLRCDGALHRVRLLGFDTPELHRAHCADELVAAKQATVLMGRLVATGPVTGLRITGQDRYGRDLAQVFVAGRDLSEAMLNSGLARPYAGGRRQGWCEGR